MTIKVVARPQAPLGNRRGILFVLFANAVAESDYNGVIICSAFVIVRFWRCEIAICRKCFML